MCCCLVQCNSTDVNSVHLYVWLEFYRNIHSGENSYGCYFKACVLLLFLTCPGLLPDLCHCQVTQPQAFYLFRLVARTVCLGHGSSVLRKLTPVLPLTGLWSPVISRWCSTQDHYCRGGSTEVVKGQTCTRRWWLLQPSGYFCRPGWKHSSLLSNIGFY